MIDQERTGLEPVGAGGAVSKENLTREELDELRNRRVSFFFAIAMVTIAITLLFVSPHT